MRKTVLHVALAAAFIAAISPLATAQSSSQSPQQSIALVAPYVNAIEQFGGRLDVLRRTFYTLDVDQKTHEEARRLFLEGVGLVMASPLRTQGLINALPPQIKKNLFNYLDESRAIYFLTAYQIGETFEVTDKAAFLPAESKTVRFVWDTYQDYLTRFGIDSPKTISAGLATTYLTLQSGKGKVAQQLFTTLEPALRKLTPKSGQSFVDARLLEISLLQERGLYDQSIVLVERTLSELKDAPPASPANIGRLNLLSGEANFQSWNWPESRKNYQAAYAALESGKLLGSYYAQIAAGGVFASDVLLDKKGSFETNYNRHFDSLSKTSEQIQRGERESGGMAFFQDIQKIGIARLYDVGPSDGFIQSRQGVTQLAKNMLGPNHPLTMEMEGLLGSLYNLTGQYEKARPLFSDLVARIEQYRADPAIDREDRQAIFARLVPIYKLYSATEQKVNPDLAFQISELSKARTLLESLMPGQALDRGIMNATDADAMRRISDELSKWRFYSAISQSPDEKKQFELAKVDALKRQELLLGELSAKYPQMQELNRLNILSAKDGAKSLKPGELLISYVAIEKTILIFTLDASGNLKSYESPVKGNLQALVEAYRSKLTDSTGERGNSKRNFVVQYRPQGSEPESSTATSEQQSEAALAKHLFDLLVQPIGVELQHSKHLIIAPDGPLAILPFEVLMDKEGKRLIEKSDISYTQSLSALALARSQSRTAPPAWEKDLLAVGGAIYRQDKNPEGAGSKFDQALNWTQNQFKEATTLVIDWFGNAFKLGNRPTSTDFRSLMVRNSDDPQIVKKAFSLLDIKWANLPGAASEVKAVSEIFGKDRSTVFIGLDANEKAFKQLSGTGELRKYKYMLFSGHGFLSTVEPSLSSLVFSLTAEALTPDTDGYLTASEIAGLSLNSELLTLSACDTGVGKVSSGEGVLGIPFAAHLAGSKSTAMSLWSVDDQSTKEFMVEMFKKLQRGEDKHTAISETKREFLKGQYPNPFHWAPFVLYGI